MRPENILTLICRMLESYLMIKKEIVVKTEKQFISLKAEINELIKDEKGTGIVNVFVSHTTCAIKVMEGEILLLSDVQDYLAKTWPKDGNYHHDIIGIRDVPINERINGFSHMRQLFFSSDVNIPCQDGRMQLGQWQDIFLIEFDPIRERKVIITYYS